MKKTFLSVSLALVFLLCHSLSFAAVSQFVGNWQNTDSRTGGITTLAITGNANALKMQAWGRCVPKDCDWGVVDAYAYSPNVSSPSEANAEAVSAVYNTAFSQTLLMLTPAANNTILAKVLTRFTDNSNRSNYIATYTFKRKPVAEDCVSFNPTTTTVRNIDGSWTIVDGEHLMFSFGDKRAEALQALRIIKYYKMNSSCFVGRPNPSFSYLLVNGNAPQGSMAGEDCVSFNPNTITVTNINGSWKIVDGSHWLFDFGSKENEARTAYEIIKKYGFTRSCFVGRPDASFKYLRK